MSEKNKTIQRILSAATDIFSEVGFAGARVDEIAKRAGVNKATIYYNIGNKKTLYTSVLQTIFDGSDELLADEVVRLGTPEEKILFYIQAVAQRIDENPNIPNLIMWEHASGGKNFSDELGIAVVRIIEMLTAILDEGERQGRFEKIDPFLLHIMIIGSFMFYKTSIPIRNNSSAFPESLKSEPEILSGRVAEKIGKYILKMVGT
jgi:TetR/AcrR family transcriptional regulator